MAFSMSMKGSGKYLLLSESTECVQIFECMLFLQLNRSSIGRLNSMTRSIVFAKEFKFFLLSLKKILQDGSGEIDPEEMEEIFTYVFICLL